MTQKRDSGQLSFMNLRRSYVVQVREATNNPDPVPAAEHVNVGEAWGYRTLVVLGAQPEARLNSGVAAQQWSEAGIFTPSTRQLRWSTVVGLDHFWLHTGAPLLTDARHFDWLADACLNEWIVVPRPKKSVGEYRFASEVYSRYRLIRLFAEYCKRLPIGHSDFADAIRNYRGHLSDFDPRRGGKTFDQTVQANAARYLSLIPRVYHAHRTSI